MKKKIAVVTDMDTLGSGYKHLSLPLLQGLAELGHDIKVAAFQYQGEPHPFDISLIPAADLPDVVTIIRNLINVWKFDILLVLLDVPLQENFLREFSQRDFKYIGVFPLEAPPLCMDWAMVISGMDKAMIISEFGTKEAENFGLQNVEHIQIGVDIDAWKAPTKEEKKELRQKFGIADDEYVILTVADNQERKNLSRAMEIVADTIYDRSLIDYAPYISKDVIEKHSLEPAHKIKYILVTREHFLYGWKLRTYADTLGISDFLIIFERGMSHSELWTLYALADAFLLTSKAEGLGMPILEAMAMKVPVICTNCTAMKELIGNGLRGYPIEYYDIPEFAPYVDPFGNGYRYFADRNDGYRVLKHVLTYADTQKRIDAAYDYVSKRTHQISVDQLEAAIKSLYE